MSSFQTAALSKVGLTPGSQTAPGGDQMYERQPNEKPSYSLAETSRFRQGVYRLLAGLLLYPVEGRLSAALEGAREIDRLSNYLPAPRPYSGWALLLGALESVVETDILGIQNEYVRLFVAGSGGIPCSPYESVYAERQEYAAGRSMAELEREYAAAGLVLSSGLSEMPDHVAVEMEFMSFLCRQAAEAWEKEDDAEAVKLLAWQASFLKRHLARWLPDWVRKVAESDCEGTYSVFAVTARAFVDLDRQIITRVLEEDLGLRQPPEDLAPTAELDG